MEFISQQTKQNKGGILLRGPYLAQMELVRILQERRSELLKLAGMSWFDTLFLSCFVIYCLELVDGMAIEGNRLHLLFNH